MIYLMEIKHALRVHLAQEGYLESGRENGDGACGKQENVATKWEGKYEVTEYLRNEVLNWLGFLLSPIV